MVKVLCYGKIKEYADRNQAIEYFKQCQNGSEGAERERYTNILCDLLWTTKDIVYDYEDEYELYLKSLEKEKKKEDYFDTKYLLKDKDDGYYNVYLFKEETNITELEKDIIELMKRQVGEWTLESITFMIQNKYKIEDIIYLDSGINVGDVNDIMKRK